MNIVNLILALILSAILTKVFQKIFTKAGGNLFTSIRGGIPRAVGIAPFIVLVLFFPAPGNYLIGIIGIFAFIDDLIGRKNIKSLPFEIGQFSRGLGLLLVILVGYIYYGPVSILIGLMIQPMNIADMEPGKACSTILIMGSLVVIVFLLSTFSLYFPALILLAACLGYAPLDYKGRIMMGEVGNHSFGVGLGILYAILSGVLLSQLKILFIGPFLFTLIFFILTVLLIAFLRRKNLNPYLEQKLKISNPTFGDYFMDVLTGGGLGDFIRRIVLGKRFITVEGNLMKLLGFRRLLYNPYC
jgi:UDP-GlcNAc:undecaprenyl-phosphate GlcNAc-1-phosphate transferase